MSTPPSSIEKTKDGIMSPRSAKLSPNLQQKHEYLRPKNEIQQESSVSMGTLKDPNESFLNNLRSDELDLNPQKANQDSKGHEHGHGGDHSQRNSHGHSHGLKKFKSRRDQLYDDDSSQASDQSEPDFDDLEGDDSYESIDPNAEGFLTRHNLTPFIRFKNYKKVFKKR